MSDVKSKRRIVLTGGGTAGHVMPNLALLPELKRRGFEVFYIGSKGIEKQLIQKEKLPFFEVQCGKLRRYVSFENTVDIFRVLIGIFQSVVLMLRIRPTVVFSKGGFVAVPVAISAALCRVPVVSHESDVTPGLANRIIAKFAKLILYSFPETKDFLPSVRSEQVPAPIRDDLLTGSRKNGLAFCGFHSERPTLLVMGGSQGAQRLNEFLLTILPELVKTMQVIHLTGMGKAIGFVDPHYKSFEFVGDQLKDVFAATDFVVTRAGANSIFEMLALNIPMLLVPLEVGSRGDQIVNANSFVASGWALSVRESSLTADLFLASIQKLVQESDVIRAKQAKASGRSSSARIVELIESVSL
jgi:UDP-N-acetylglucosamine--N-acetylmuramyl-(pentapeptide) pyrophosphoryl-undecaprenol N-acetylglucosamine transferase